MKFISLIDTISTGRCWGVNTFSSSHRTEKDSSKFGALKWSGTAKDGPPAIRKANRPDTCLPAPQELMALSQLHPAPSIG